MRVYELSKEINVPNKELVEYLSKSNSDIKTHSSSVISWTIMIPWRP